MRAARKKSIRVLPAALLTIVLTLAAAPAALANVGETIIQRCVNSESIAGYSQSAYSQALSELDAGTEEYGECGTLIRQAQLAAAAGSGAAAQQGAANPTVLPTTPAEQRQIAGAAKAGADPVRVGGETIRPGVIHANVSSAVSSLPGPLIALLSFLLVCLLIAGGAALRSRVRPGDRS